MRPRVVIEGTPGRWRYGVIARPRNKRTIQFGTWRAALNYANWLSSLGKGR